MHRLTPGFETTFLDGLMSFEARVPVASTLNSSDFMDTSHVELGNVNLNLKGVFFQRWDWLASAGLGVTLPTADDPTGGGAIENSAIHLLPFAGAIYQPNDRFYTQGFAQVDFDVNGNTLAGATIHDPTLLFLDWQAGYWFYRCPCQQADVGHRRYGASRAGPSHLHISGIASSIELNYTGSLADRDSDGLNVLNGSVGATVELSNDATLDVGYVFPLVGGDDQQFDGEVRVMFNYFFPTRRRTNVRANPYAGQRMSFAGYNHGY